MPVAIRNNLHLERNMQAIANGAFRRMVDYALVRAKYYATAGRPHLNRQTGALEKSIKKGPYLQRGVGAAGEQKIYSNLVYAAIHEFGGVIRAKNKPYLVFKVNGHWYRKKQVTIPKRPYFQPAADEAIAKWPEFVEETITFIAGGVP